MNLIEFFGTTVKPKITKGKNMLNPIPTGKIIANNAENRFPVFLSCKQN